MSKILSLVLVASSRMNWLDVDKYLAGCTLSGMK